MTQAQVGRMLGLSASQVSRTECGLSRGLGVQRICRHAAAVGLKPSIRFFPIVRQVLDKPQLDLLARLLDRVHHDWKRELEVPMPIAGDLRAADLRITNATCSVLIEGETRFWNAQAQLRAAQLKRRDLGATRLILLVAATTANRRALREAAPVLRQAFSLGTRAVLAALAAGDDPGGDGIVVL